MMLFVTDTSEIGITQKIEFHLKNLNNNHKVWLELALLSSGGRARS